MTHFSLHRRTLLKGAGASLALAALNAAGMNSFEYKKTYRVALIGTGWYGKNDLFRLMQVAPVQVVALCDTDKHHLSEAAAMVQQRSKGAQPPRLYNEFRKMLSENEPDIVLIGTPDHWHALTSIEAMKAGAHVYVQKPISVDVVEGEAMVAAARKYNRVVQVGTQRRSTPHLLEAKQKIVDAGLLGTVAHADMCCYYHMRSNADRQLQPIPAFLDYDMWTGPAPLRPYDGLPHGSWWRAFMEYSNGIVGDMCVHMFDAVRWMLNLGWPKRVSSSGGIYVEKTGKANISDTQSALFEYDGMTCVWEHRTWGTPADEDYPWAFTLYGDKGTLKADVYKYDFIPLDGGKTIHGDVVYEKEKYPEDVTEPRIELHTAPATRQHMHNFLHAIETGTRPVADIEQGHISTASCILANMSMLLHRPLAYDAATRTIPGDTEATMMLERAYRGQWKHPHPNDV